LLGRKRESDKSRNIAARRDLDPKVAGVSRLQIILGKALPNVTRGAAHNVIGCGVVVWRTSEYFYPDIPLFEVLGIAIEGLPHNVCQKIRASLTPPENGAGQQPPELFADGFAVFFGFRRPSLPVENRLRECWDLHGRAPPNGAESIRSELREEYGGREERPLRVRVFNG
jgi:hypothetical protein